MIAYDLFRLLIIVIAAAVVFLTIPASCSGISASTPSSPRWSASPPRWSARTDARLARRPHDGVNRAPDAILGAMLQQRRRTRRHVVCAAFQPRYALVAAAHD